MEKMERLGEISPKSLSRAAGVLYLIIIVTGMTSELVVRGTLLDVNDPSVTVRNIASSQYLFKLGFLADSVMLLCDVAIATLFFVLLKHVNQTLSLIAAAFRLTQAAILGMNLLNYYAVFLLIDGGHLTETISLSEKMIALFIKMHAYGYDLGLIFFGVSNLVLGYLVIKSEWFPSLFGYGLQAVGVAYLAGSYGRFMFSEPASLFETAYIIPFVVETAFCLWLIFKGVTARKDEV